MLPAVVLAHQSGMGANAYKRQNTCKKRIRVSKDYELRGVTQPFRGGKRTAWSVWRIGVDYPYRVYDIVSSTFPEVVKADLAAWLVGV